MAARPISRATTLRRRTALLVGASLLLVPGTALADDAAGSGADAPVAGAACADHLVTLRPDGASGPSPRAAAVTAQALDAEQPGWAMAGWQADAGTTISAVKAVGIDGAVRVLPGTADGVAYDVLALHICGEVGAATADDDGRTGDTAATAQTGGTDEPAADSRTTDPDPEATVTEGTGSGAADTDPADTQPQPAATSGGDAGSEGMASSTEEPATVPAASLQTVALDTVIDTGSMHDATIEDTEVLGVQLVAAEQRLDPSSPAGDHVIQAAPATAASTSTSAVDPARVLTGSLLGLALAGAALLGRRLRTTTDHGAKEIRA